jgi:hypothetical protein
MRTFSLLSFSTLGALIVATTASSATYREVSKAVTDDTMLATAGVTPTDARLRKQCRAAVIDTDDSPDFFDCVYVQTDRELNLFSLEDGFLMNELELTLRNIDGVALQRLDRWAQVQIFSGRRVAALYIHGNGWIDSGETEGVYKWLLDHGVPARAPRVWIGP